MAGRALSTSSIALSVEESDNDDWVAGTPSRSLLASPDSAIVEGLTQDLEEGQWDFRA
jgi:hypothetical protein